MKLLEFDADSELLRRFLDWPKQHYASDANWMADPGEARLLADPGSRAATWRNFLVMAGDTIRGRATAIINPGLCDERKQPYGQLGFFECVDDPLVARLLVDAAAAWLRKNLPRGCSMLAPMNFDTWHPYRLRTAGLGEPTFLMEPYSPPYYPALLAGMNFTPVSQYVTKTVTDPTMLLGAWEPHYRSAVAGGYGFRNLDVGRLSSEMSLIYRLSLAAFRDNLFFTEIAEAEFRAMYAGTAGSLDPELFVFVLNPSAEEVGLAFSIADHRLPETVNFKTFGIVPGLHGKGLGAALAFEVYRRFQSKGFSRVNHCLMRAGNRADDFDRGLGKVTRAYTFYTRPL
jgi:hypothetical protein